MARSTEEVVRHHCQVLAAGDVAATVSDYAPDAFIITPGGVVQGREALTAFFENSVATCMPPDARQEFLKTECYGELGQIVWTGNSRFCDIPFGTDTFVVRDGLIVMQTFAGIINNKQEDAK